jgi:outer membrane protein assembly factor BamB
MRAYDWCWRPFINHTFDGNDGMSLDVAIPNVQGNIRCIREGEFIIGGTSGKNNGTYVEDGNLWALSLEPGKEGTLLWSRTFTPPEGPPDSAAGAFGMGALSGPTVDPEDGVFIFSESINRRRWGYDLNTCEMLWGPTDSESQLNYYGMSTNIYDGKLLSCGYGGELIAYDIRTGDILWKYNAENVGFESPYGNYPTGIVFIADGKIYLTSSEHSPTQPLWRGPNLRCIDAETGDEVWKVLFWGAGMGSGSGAVIADGYIVGLNFYDNQLYCFGKGPSKTTIAVQSDIVSWGEKVLFKGTVTDVAAGTKQIEQAARFPNGVPAIADEYQEDWMEYVYMQQPCPTYVEGVEVKLETLDPNNNFYEIGTVSSDASGFYSLDWEPPVPGKYTIYATFEGSNSYYRSYSETAILVTEE